MTRRPFAGRPTPSGPSRQKRNSARLKPPRNAVQTLGELVADQAFTDDFLQTAAKRCFELGLLPLELLFAITMTESARDKLVGLIDHMLNLLQDKETDTNE